MIHTFATTQNRHSVLPAPEMRMPASCIGSGGGQGLSDRVARTGKRPRGCLRGRWAEVSSPECDWRRGEDKLLMLLFCSRPCARKGIGIEWGRRGDRRLGRRRLSEARSESVGPFRIPNGGRHLRQAGAVDGVGPSVLIEKRESAKGPRRNAAAGPMARRALPDVDGLNDLVVPAHFCSLLATDPGVFSGPKFSLSERHYQC